MDKRISPVEARILTLLVKNEDYMNTAEIAKKAKISWNTAFSYLNKFESKGWVEKYGEGTIYWKAIIEN